MSLATYGQDLPLLPELKTQFARAEQIDIIVSFVMKSGIAIMEQEIRRAVAQNIPIRILTSTYMNITDPTALAMLKDWLGTGGEIRLYNGSADSFHPKAYIFHGNKTDCIFVGSSNMSKTALTHGVEWNYKIEKETDKTAYEAFSERFEYLYKQEAYPLTDQVLKDYRNHFVANRPAKGPSNSHFRKYKRKSHSYELAEPDMAGVAEVFAAGQPNVFQAPINLYQPNDAQIEALIELKRTRLEGNKKALVIAATGLGKTYLAAFDSRDYDSILFVAHREEILNQAYETFFKVRGEEGLGKLYDGRMDYGSKVLFASVQTLMRPEHLNRFDKEQFNHIIFDEVHHISSNSYRKILDYFDPDFMLGITATPYRMDRQNVFELFDYNVVYEADLFTAINRDWLAPFYYYGIYDFTVNYDNVTYINGKYVEAELEQAFNKNARADLILKHFGKGRSKRTLGFCATIKHADYMAECFNSAGIRAVSVHSGSESVWQMHRKEAIDKLTSGEIEVLFSVDMLNEGLDVPLVDTLLFLRPTESSTIFLQQLGRGLRKAPGKKRVRVLDFIGNYKKANLIPFLLGGRHYNEGQDPATKANKKQSWNPAGRKGLNGLLEEEGFFPEGCRIDFEFEVIDLMDRLIQSKTKLKDRIQSEFAQLNSELGSVPSRMAFFEAMETDFYKSVKADRKSNPFVDYVDFLETMQRAGVIDETGVQTLGDEARKFIRFIETTSMNQLYKLPVLLAFCDDGWLKKRVGTGEIVDSFRRFYQNAQNAKDLTRNKSGMNYLIWKDEDYQRLAYNNPVKFLCKTHSDIFRMDVDSKELRIVLDLGDDWGRPELAAQVMDAIHLRRSDFLNTRLEKWEET